MLTTITVREDGSRKVSQETNGETRVEQNHKKRVNINTIVGKAKKTGLLPQQNGKCVYGDFTGSEDFHSAQNSILAAHDAFCALPSELRDRFLNDPGKLLDFVNDPSNEAESIKLGLLPKLPQEPEVPATEPDASPGEPDGEPDPVT